MKPFLSFFILLISFSAVAQSFEGTITWSIKYELTDPQKQADMLRSQQNMNNPANQEKMKKMQEQMNSPEMKAMMEKNPQMKAQMENAMKAMQGGGAGGILPKSFTVKSKANNYLTKMEGGMMNMEVLFLAEKKQSYRIDRAAKTYSLLPSGTANTTRDSVQYKVTKTGESMKVLNYTCTKYIVEVTGQKGNIMNQVFWTTSDIKGLDLKNLSHQKMGNSGQSFYYEGISGVPLRMEMVSAEMNMVMEVTDIKKESLPADDFTIPADFKEITNPYAR